MKIVIVGVVFFGFIVFVGCIIDLFVVLVELENFEEVVEMIEWFD